MRNNSYLFLLVLIAITLMTSGCETNNKNEHNHEYIDGICSCGDKLEQTYKVSFVDYDGKVLKQQEVKKNESASSPTDPVRDGYTFIGWSSEFKNITSDLVVVAMYELINDVNISVSPAYDFIFEGNVLIEYTGFQNIVSIPSYYECDGQKIKVKEIGESAFYDILSLVEVHIPNTVEIIGKQSFMRCENLKNVIMGDNVIEIQS